MPKLTDVRPLWTEPLWRPIDLGQPIPASVHAVSVCLPTWADNIGYEEGEPRVMSALQAGYPRFVFHPLCQTLFARCIERFGPAGAKCLAFPSRGSAERFERFLVDKSSRGCLSVHDAGGYVACIFDAAQAAVAKSYWQHTGEGITSRLAERALAAWPGPLKASSTGAESKSVVRERLARAYGSAADDVFLFPTGITAIYNAHRALSALRGRISSVQVGFPYVDTLKILQKFGASGQLCATGADAELAELERQVRSGGVAGVFTEVPSNPLLQTPDLHRLRAVTSESGTALIVDDTIATPVNVDVLSHCDGVCTSLTKFFSGVGDVTGGALVLNPRGPMYAALRAALADVYEDLLGDADAETLELNSRGFEARVAQVNRSAEAVAEGLRRRPQVESVYYPKFQTRDRYDAFKRPGGGYGGLLSIVLRDAPRTTPAFFDALRVCKGPNLGSEYTLACPYTLLAHYGELDWAESCGVSRHLVRVSIGLESPDDLLARFDEALAVANA
jgi:cystathionine gamma-synthase